MSSNRLFFDRGKDGPRLPWNWVEGTRVRSAPRYPRQEADLVRSLFGKKKKKKPRVSAETTETIGDARVGDVFTVSGRSVIYDDAYFIVENLNRYESNAGESYELLGVDGDTRMWVEWSGRGNTLSVAIREYERPMGLERLGLTEEDLVRMDEQHSLDNSIEYEGTCYHYSNSGESFFFEGGSTEGQGFYLWELASEDNERFASIVKWEGMPFEAYLSESVSLDSITVYRK